jgi:hypothetical protein
MNRQKEPEDRAMLALRKMNQSVANPPVFLALAETFDETSRMTTDHREREHLQTMSASCRWRHEEQKARCDFSPSWERPGG